MAIYSGNNLVATKGGVSNYPDLDNKPQINNVILTGNKTAEDLGLQAAGDYALKSEIPTNTSDLINDSNFITTTDLNAIYSTNHVWSGDNTYTKLLNRQDTLSTNPSVLINLQDTNDKGYAQLTAAYDESGALHNQLISHNNTANKTSYLDITCDETGTYTVETYGTANYFLNDNSVTRYIDVKDEINKNRTNCITKIPQDIKLELNDGTLTLKAGSVYYKCDGNFTKYTTSEDQSRKPTVSAQLFMYIDENNNFAEYFVDRFFSGDSAPTVSSSTAFWYDTTTKKMKKTLDTGGSWFESNISLPMALVTCDATQGITSIDQVFNGFGYFDRTLFALPGVEGLIPNGRGKNGELINNKFSTENLILRTFPENDEYQVCTLYCNNESFGVLPNANIGDLVYDFYYDKNLNYNINKDPNDLYIDNKYPYCIISNNFVKKNGKIIALNLNTAFQTISYDDVNNNIETILNTEKSNCLTKVPNLIKLIKNTDRSLTLKWGSKIYVPYGKDTFKIIEAKSDIQRPNNIDKNAIITCIINFNLNRISGLEMCSINNTFSGETQPEDFIDGYWYDTLNNKLYSNTVSEGNLRSLPIGYIDNNDELHVFNGFGFIGNTIFALPGIEGLIPFGRNLDNKLRSVKLKNYDVQLRAVDPQNSVHTKFAFATTGIGIYNYIYDWKKNELSNTNSILYDRFVAGKLNISSDGRILDLLTDYPFSCVSYNEYEYLVSSVPSSVYQKMKDITNTTISLVDGISIYKLNNITSTMTVSFVHTALSNLSIDRVITFELYIPVSSTVPAITWPTGVVWLAEETPTFEANTNYLLAFRSFDQGVNWIGNMQCSWPNA